MIIKRCITCVCVGVVPALGVRTTRRLFKKMLGNSIDENIFSFLLWKELINSILFVPVEFSRSFIRFGGKPLAAMVNVIFSQLY